MRRYAVPVVLTLLAVFTAGCDSPAYESVDDAWFGKTGYSSYATGKDTLYVCFRAEGGPHDTDSARWRKISDYALLRASELTLAAKHTRFTVTEREQGFAESETIPTPPLRPGEIFQPEDPRRRKIRTISSSPYVALRIRLHDTTSADKDCHEAESTAHELKKRYGLE